MFHFGRIIAQFCGVVTFSPPPGRRGENVLSLGVCFDIADCSAFVSPSEGFRFCSFDYAFDLGFQNRKIYDSRIVKSTIQYP